jgi:hypothetical protein
LEEKHDEDAGDQDNGKGNGRNDVERHGQGRDDQGDTTRRGQSGLFRNNESGYVQSNELPMEGRLHDNNERRSLIRSVFCFKGGAT